MTEPVRVGSLRGIMMRGPSVSATLPVYASAMSVGYAEQDTGAVCGVLEKMAGVKRKKSGKQKKRKE